MIAMEQNLSKCDEKGVGGRCEKSCSSCSCSCCYFTADTAADVGSVVVVVNAEVVVLVVVAAFLM